MTERRAFRGLRRPIVVAGVALAGITLALSACTPPDAPPAHDVIVNCIPGETCDATAITEESTLQLVTEVGDAGQITIDVDEGPPLDCTGILPSPFYVPVNPHTYTFNTTNGAAKTATITTPNADAILDPIPGASKWSLGVCFGAPHPFTSLNAEWSGSGIPFTGPAQLDDATGLYVGLLPPCISFLGLDAPCVSARSIDSAGTASTTADLPEGDPIMK